MTGNTQLCILTSRRFIPISEFSYIFYRKKKKKMEENRSGNIVDNLGESFFDLLRVFRKRRTRKKKKKKEEINDHTTKR